MVSIVCATAVGVLQGVDSTTPVLEMLVSTVSAVLEPTQFHGSDTSASEAGRVGWTVLRAVLRTWGVGHTSCSSRKMRVQRAQEVIDRACEQKVLYEAGVGHRGGSECFPSSWPRAAEMSRALSSWCLHMSLELQVRIDALVFRKTSHPFPLPMSRIFRGWMSQRNCELRHAVEFGDPVLVAKTGRSGWARRINALHSWTRPPRDDPPNRHLRRRDAFTVSTRRRTIRHPTDETSRDARCGLRGVRGRGKSPRFHQKQGVSPCRQCARGGFG